MTSGGSLELQLRVGVISLCSRTFSISKNVWEKRKGLFVALEGSTQLRSKFLPSVRKDPFTRCFSGLWQKEI